MFLVEDRLAVFIKFQVYMPLGPAAPMLDVNAIGSIMRVNWFM